MQNKSTVLKKVKERRVFDINSKKDVQVYVDFLKTGAWGLGGCPFKLQFPYVNVPDMIKDKLVHKFLKVEKRV
jgi:hypothetical protein